LQNRTKFLKSSAAQAHKNALVQFAQNYPNIGAGAQAHHEAAASHATDSAEAAATGDADGAVASSQAAVSSAAAVASHTKASESTPVAEVVKPLSQAASMLTQQGQPAAAAQVAQNARKIEYYYQGKYGVNFDPSTQEATYTRKNGKSGTTKMATLQQYQKDFLKDRTKFLKGSAAQAHKNALVRFAQNYPNIV
jgi:hypothetical protein